MKAKIIEVGYQGLLQFIKGNERGWVSDLPDDAFLRDIWMEPDRQSVFLLVESQDWEDVPEGVPFPNTGVSWQTTDYQGIAQQLIDEKGWNG